LIAIENIHPSSDYGSTRKLNIGVCIFKKGKRV